jgi:hypothetical protein
MRVHQLFIHFKKAYDSVRKEVLFNILIEFGVHMKLVGLIKIYVNKTYNKVRIRKHLSDMFPLQNGLTEEDALLQSLFNLAFEYAITKVQENQVELKIK